MVIAKQLRIGGCPKSHLYCHTELVEVDSSGRQSVTPKAPFECLRVTDPTFWDNLYHKYMKLLSLFQQTSNIIFKEER